MILANCDMTYDKNRNHFLYKLNDKFRSHNCKEVSSYPIQRSKFCGYASIDTEYLKCGAEKLNELEKIVHLKPSTYELFDDLCYYDENHKLLQKYMKYELNPLWFKSVFATSIALEAIKRPDTVFDKLKNLIDYISKYRFRTVKKVEYFKEYGESNVQVLPGIHISGLTLSNEINQYINTQEFKNGKTPANAYLDNKPLLEPEAVNETNS